MRQEKKSVKNKSEIGFTLIELVISMSVFLVGIAAIYGVIRIATIQKNTVSTRTDQMRSARIALEYLRRDAVNAGFGYSRAGGNVPDNGIQLFPIPPDADADRDLLTAISAGNDISTNSLNFGTKMDGIAFASRDILFNVDPAAPAEGGKLVNYISAAASGTSVNLTTKPGEAANCKPYDLYLIEPLTGTTQIIAMATSVTPSANTIQLAVGDSFGLNQSATGSGFGQNLLMTPTGAGGGTIKRINLVSYRITADGVLVRERFGNQSPPKTAAEQTETRELVYGVSDFQIKYFLEDGTTVDDPSSANNGKLNQQKMNNVVQIQVSITLAAEADGQLKVSSPITIKEYISTRNLRYASS